MYENQDDADKDLAGFSLVNASIYTAVVKGHACEQSARYDCSNLLFSILIPVLFSQTTMDNASKNAKDMIDSLQMNHGRQAAITNELVDIITGKFDSSPCIPSPYTPSTCAVRAAALHGMSEFLK